MSSEARVIAGRYELQSLIGEGGMASVWRARDLTLERQVAVKLLFARDERDRQALVNQFLREARIAASVQHRNVIHIVDFGTTDEEQPYMVMELLEGGSLGEALTGEKSLTLNELVQVSSLTLRGLAAVHDAGIIHRDLKPDNIFLTRDSGGAYFPKILDFGISRSVEPRSGRRSALTTKEGIIVGTPEYMSPEQARGIKSIDRRTDIYSMGVILYEAMSGQLPFASENVGDLIIQIVTGSAPRVHELNPSIPEAISEVVAKAMARAPEDRYQTAAAMQDALLAAAQDCPNTEVRRSLSDLPPPPLAQQAFEPPRQSQDRLRTLEFPLADDESGEAAEEAATKAAAASLAAARDPTGAHALPAPEPVDSELPEDPFGRKPSGTFGRVALAAGVIGLGVVGWQLTRGDAPPPTASMPRPQPVAAPAPAPPEPELPPAPATEPEPLPTHVTVTLRNVPKGAKVTVDGKPTGTVIELPRDNRNRIIKVVARGKSPWQAVHHASADSALEVLMVDAQKPRARAQQPTAKRKQAKPKKKPPSVLRKLDF